jgi:hypothetical protein
MKIPKNFRVGSPIGSQFAGLDQRRVPNYGGQERAGAQKVDQIFAGHGEPGTRALALDRGAFAFLAKPLDDEVFLAAVHGALVE